MLSKGLSSDSERLFRGSEDASIEILEVLETPDANRMPRVTSFQIPYIQLIESVGQNH